MKHALLALMLAMPIFTVGAEEERTERQSTLAEQWSPSDQALRMHKQNYFLFFARSSNPNDTPSSPNPASQVPPSYQLDHNEMSSRWRNSVIRK